MKKRLFFLALAGALLLSACAGTPSDPIGSDTGTAPAETTAAPTDGAQETTLSCGWYGARVAFATQKTTVDPDYLLSDIIKLSAGDVLTVKTSAPEGDRPDAETLTVSSWKQRFGQTEYVFDPIGAYADGESVALSVATDGSLTYTYTAEGSEQIRVCVKRTADGTAPTCTVRAKSPVSVLTAGMEAQIAWTNGYVGSSTNGDGYQNKVYNGKGGYYYSDVIRLGKAGTRVRFIANYKGLTSTNAYVVSAWKQVEGEWALDTDGLNIPGPDDSGSSTVISFMKNSKREYCYVSGTDGECIRFCYVVGNGLADKPVTSVSIEQTGETKTFATVADWVEHDKSRAYLALFEGKTINVIGDSLFTPAGEIHKDNVWVSLLAKKYGMTYVDCAISGSTISNKDTNDNPMVDRVAKMPDNDPDIVIFEGSRNDYNHGVPFGTDDPNDLNTQTLKGAVRYMLKALREKYPNATIVCMNYWDTPSGANATGKTCNEYAVAMLETCRELGFLTVDLMDKTKSGANMQDTVFRSLYSRAPDDVSHLTDRGMRYVYPYLEASLAEVLTKQN